jgi:hypothetical protein
VPAFSSAETEAIESVGGINWSSLVGCRLSAGPASLQRR